MSGKLATLSILGLVSTTLSHTVKGSTVDESFTKVVGESPVWRFTNTFECFVECNIGPWVSAVGRLYIRFPTCPLGSKERHFHNRNMQQDSCSTLSIKSSPSSFHWVTIGVFTQVNIPRMQFIDSLQLHTRQC
jgi:hypothetical protein